MDTAASGSRAHREKTEAADDAEVGRYDENFGFVVDDEEQRQPQVSEVSPERSLPEDDPRSAAINFGPVEEGTDDRVLESDNRWDDRGRRFLSAEGISVADGSRGSSKTPPNE